MHCNNYDDIVVHHVFDYREGKGEGGGGGRSGAEKEGMGVKLLVIRTKSPCQEKSSAPEIKGTPNRQMYHSDGLKILNLDLRGLGRDRKSESGT